MVGTIGAGMLDLVGAGIIGVGTDGVGTIGAGMDFMILFGALLFMAVDFTTVGHFITHTDMAMDTPTETTDFTETMATTIEV